MKTIICILQMWFYVSKGLESQIQASNKPVFLVPLNKPYHAHLQMTQVSQSGFSGNTATCYSNIIMPWELKLHMKERIRLKKLQQCRGGRATKFVWCASNVCWDECLWQKWGKCAYVVQYVTNLPMTQPCFAGIILSPQFARS